MKASIPLIFLLSGSIHTFLTAGVVPHPDKPYRLLETRGDYSVEYSKGREAYAEAAFASMREWSVEVAKIRREGESVLEAPGPLTYTHMRERKEDFLSAITVAIGLEEPIPLMIETYDHFVDTYEQIAIAKHFLYTKAWEEASFKHAVVWLEAELNQRLKDGETFPRFSINEEKGGPSYQGGLNYDIEDEFISDRSEELAKRIRNRKIQGTIQSNETLNWKDGETSQTGTASASVKRKSIPDLVKMASEAADDKQDTPPTGPNFLPLVIKDADAGKEPGKFVDEKLKSVAAYWLQFVSNLPAKIEAYAKGSDVRLILHETTEVGLVETYMNSPLRSRAALDGTAEYVSWKVLSELVVQDIVKQIFPYAAQAKSYAPLQDKLDLGFWIAMEIQDPKDEGTELQRARYLFSTFAFFLIAKHSGKDAVANIWQEVGKTSSRRASIMTINSACRKMTGKFFLDFLEQVEQTPVEELLELLELQTKPD